MKIMSVCRNFFGGAYDRCFRLFPCLADPARRSSLGLKVTLVVLHLVFAGVLFLFDDDLVQNMKQEPWYMALYLLLFVSTLVQYFATSCSSPGYVLDAMRAVNEQKTVFSRESMTSKQPASSKNGSLTITVDANQSGRNLTSWTTLVLNMYPPATSISLREQSIAMIVTDVFFSLIIIVFGLEHALVREIIVNSGGTFVKKQHCACGLAYCTLHT